MAVVTGASAGVGRATAVALAEAGYDVGLVARGQAGLEAAADDVTRHGGRALAVPADVARWDDVRHVAREVEDRLGPIELWVNSAMTTVFAPAWEVDPADLRRATEVTYLGQVHGALAALEHMRPRNRGTILSVGSALAFRAIPLQSAYCGAKFATRGFMEALRTELLHERSGVMVTMVHLPGVNTPQFGWCRTRLPHHPQPVPPVYEPELVARAIVAAARRRQRQRIVGSWNWLLVQGNKVAPGLFDHYAARSAWSGQQAEQLEPRDNPMGNLEEPLDHAPGSDHGARGRFSDLTGGVRARGFVRSLPEVGRTLQQAVVDRARETWATSRPPANPGRQGMSAPAGRRLPRAGLEPPIDGPSD